VDLRATAEQLQETLLAAGLAATVGIASRCQVPYLLVYLHSGQGTVPQTFEGLKVVVERIGEILV